MMKKFSFAKPFAVLVIVLTIWLQWKLSAPDSLLKGQTLKQAHGFAMTQAFTKQLRDEGRLKLLGTWLPCPDPQLEGSHQRRWVEEPPVFYVLSALVALGGFEQAWAVPLLIHVLLWPLLYWIFGFFPTTQTHRTSWATFAFCTPIWVRYGVQHLPDPLAVLFLVGAFLMLLRRHHLAFYVLGTLAVTTKALCFVPLAAMVITGPFYENQKAHKLKLGLMHLLGLAGTLIPFALWLWVLKTNEIPSPFFKETSGDGLRHTGSWSLLFEARFWSRFVTWNFVKGLGLVASATFLWFLLRCFKKAEFTQFPKPLIGMLVALIPYWLLIREGNYIHDYYSLPFVWGMMVLTALFLAKNASTIKKFLDVIVFASVVVATTQIYSLSKGTPEPVNFCEAELSQFEETRGSDR